MKGQKSSAPPVASKGAHCLNFQTMAWKTNPTGLERKAKRAFGEWLSIPDWDWFTTFTFNRNYVSPRAADQAWYNWLNTLRITAESSGESPAMYGLDAPFYFRVTEYQQRGTLHYHALIGGVGDIRRLDFKDWWEMYGYARVVAYRPGLGANYYVGKYLTKEHDGDIRFSNNLKYAIVQYQKT